MNHDGSLDVLLLDDDKDLYDYYVILFRKHFKETVRIHHCLTGAELTDALSDRDYDVVILDQRLRDGERGLDLVPNIRQSSPRTVILMNSAYGSENLAAEAIRQGVDDYIEGKKEDTGKLIEAVRRAVETVHADQEIDRHIRALDDERKSVEEECATKLDSIKRKIGASIRGR